MLIANTGQSLVVMNLRTGEQVQLPPGQMTPVLDSKIPFIDDSFVLISLFNAGVLVAYTDAGAAYPGFPTTANPADSKRIPPVDADYAAAVVGAAGVLSNYSQRAVSDQLFSASSALRDYNDNSAFVEQFSNLTAWTLAGTPGIQVSGGDAFATNPSQGGGSGANKAFALAAGENLRAVFIVNHILDGSSGGVVVGVSSDTAGGTPSNAAGAAFGLYFNCYGSKIQQCSSGVFSDIAGSPASVTGQYVVTVTVDQQWISVVARLVGGTSEIRARRARAGFTVNNLYMFISDSRNTAGDSVKAVGARKQFGSIAPRTDIEGVGQTTHWSGDGTNNFKLILPSSYDSRVPVPVVVMFHGNGSDENRFSDNGNGVAASSALLSAGYAVISCTYAANTSTWGADASINAYVAAYRFFRDRYALGPVLFYGNSMGALESLLALNDGRIPGVCGWAATHPATNLAAAYADRFSVGFTSLIRTAYGIASDGSDYASKTAGHDPNLLNFGTAFRGVPKWILYSTDDAAVDQSLNAVSFISRAAAVGEAVQSQTTTGGHSASISSFTASLVAFFNACIGR